MGETELTVILYSAATLAFVHTAIGVDHYLPFVVLGRAQGWSVKKLIAVTGACGVGHVVTSVLLGMLGVGIGASLESLQGFQQIRGSLTAWLLIGFGLAYGAWGIWRALRGRSHQHAHVHGDGTVHTHDHSHRGGHLHPHPEGKSVVTVWALFIILAFGPCEALIPLMMAPAVSADWGGIVMVVSLFGSITVGTMLAFTVAGFYGLSLARTGALQRYVHAIAGLTIAASGVAIQLLGI